MVSNKLNHIIQQHVKGVAKNMKTIINADNDKYQYEITFTDDHLDNSNFVDVIIKQDGEDYYETWTILVDDLYDVAKLFKGRKTQ